MKKRLFAILSLILILCSILALPALALEIDPDAPLDPIDPEEPYVNIAYYNCGCSINSNGRAFCSSYAETRNTTYKVYISISLQRYKDGYWQTYAGPWSNSGSNGYCTTYKYYYVVSGYYYRTASAVTVRTANGTFVETAHLNSPSYYY